MSKITELFNDTCQTNAKKDAIYFYDNALQMRTYENLNADINSCINYLNSKGIKTGDRVFIFAPASYRLTVFMIAAFKLGIQVMFLDINARQETFRKLFNRFQPKYVLISNKTKFFRIFFSSVFKIRNVLNLDKIKPNPTAPEQLPEISDTTPALLTTTTGSTGLPKIVVRSHQDLYNQLELIDKNLPKSSRSTILSTSYIYTFAILARGDAAILPQINLSWPAEKINQRLQHFADIPITIIITSPVFGLKANNVFPELKQLYIGGASISLQEAETIAQKFPDSRVYIVYGATECNIMARTTLANYMKELRENYRSTLGRPFDGVSLQIAEDESIIVSCNALIKGFINEKSEYATREGDWYNTNDKGYIKDGVLYYRGKYNYFVTLGDAKYYNHELEQFLSVKFPDYKKCAVVQKRNKIYLFGTEREHERELVDALHKKYGIDVQFRHIKQIPHDVRHHTKTDYKQLLAQI